MSGRETITSRRIVRRVMSFLAVLCLLGGVPAAGRAAGEAEAAGQRIARVVVEGNERTSTHRILGQMRLREGSVYTPEAVDQDLKRIIDLREFDNVILRPQQEADGLVLVVEVTERPVLARLEFAGNEHFSDKNLAETVGLKEGEAIDRHRIFTGAQAIEQKYREAGYYFVGVTLDEDLLADRQVARFTVAEGPRVRVRKITFVGNPSIPASELRKRMETRPWFPILVAGVYDE